MVTMPSCRCARMRQHHPPVPERVDERDAPGLQAPLALRVELLDAKGRAQAQDARADHAGRDARAEHVDRPAQRSRAAAKCAATFS